MQVAVHIPAHVELEAGQVDTPLDLAADARAQSDADQVAFDTARNLQLLAEDEEATLNHHVGRHKAFLAPLDAARGCRSAREHTEQRDQQKKANMLEHRARFPQSSNTSHYSPSIQGV